MSMVMSNKNREELEILCKRSPLYAWSNQQNTVDQEPWLIYISLTNVCNHRCLVCARKDVMRNETGMMDLALFKEVVDQLPNAVQRVYLIKQGEPLLHANLPEMMKYLKEKRPDIEVALHTNAAKLTQKLSEVIVEYIDFFAVSIFSINPDTYKKVHGVDNFDLVIDNVKEFLEIREKSGSRVKFFVDYVRQDDNSYEADEEVFAFFEREFPGASVGIHWCANFLGFGEQGHLEIHNNLSYGQFPTCVFPWVSFTICWDGMVDYCFVEPEEKYFLGNIREKSISEIWNDTRYKEFRQLLLEKDLDSLKKKGIHCRNCSWLWGLKNQSIENLVMGTKKKCKSNGAELIVTGEEYLLEGFQNYLSGELAYANQNFHLANIISKDQIIRNKAEEWINSINRIYNSQVNKEIWERWLNKEGKSLRQFNVSRYNTDMGRKKCL